MYGEVFMYKSPETHQPIVLKIIPIEGDFPVNGEPQKRFDEILQEIVISMELSDLRNGRDYSTDAFVNVKRVTCVQGAYPSHLIEEWELYRDNRVEGSENDHPGVFPYDQLYVVFELCNGGRDLEAFVFNNAEEAQSIFLQVSFLPLLSARSLSVVPVFILIFDGARWRRVSASLVHSFPLSMTRLHTHPLRLVASTPYFLLTPFFCSLARLPYDFNDWWVNL